MALMIDTREVMDDEVVKIHDFGNDVGIFVYPNGGGFIGLADDIDPIIFPLSNVVRGDRDAVVANLIEKWKVQ